MYHERPLHEDLKATLDARRDLGPDYEKALVESFADRLDETIAGRVRAELAAQGAGPEMYGPRPKAKSPGSAMTPIVLGSLGIGVPLTAIAAGQAGLLGLAIAWLAIVIINVAAASAIMRRP
ncbi:hypothetical protein AB0G05_08620 [Nonomuraea wenchangensis]